MLLLYHINQCFCEVPIAYHCHELGPRDRPRAAPEHGKHCLLTSFSRPYRSINHTIQADISFHCSMSLCVAIGYTSCVFIWNALDDSDNTQ